MIQKYLKDLVAIPGISAHEKPVREYILKHLKKTRADVEVNNLGCITATFDGKKKTAGKILIDAHMDEIGFVVQHIEKNGFLRMVNFGGIDPRVVPNQRLEVHSTKGKRFMGVCGLLPPHVTGGKEATVIPLDQLTVDCGFKTDTEVKKAGIRVGSAITFPGNFVELENGRFSSKALDDRLGCALLLATADHLDKKLSDRTVVISFSTQEEVGAKGINSSIQKILPEYALIVEGTLACDMAGISDDKKVTRLGEGVAITVADSSAFVCPDMVDFLVNIAEKHKIKYQFKTPRYGGTNAGELYTVVNGIKTGIVAVPARYIHSAVSVSDWSDVRSAENFIKKYIGEL
jgi:endoglucanase